MEQISRYGQMVGPGRSGDPRRVAIMVEPEAWLRHQDCADAMMFRGAFIAGWGYVETTINELAFRCSKCDQYEGLRSNYPFRFDSKLAFFRAVLDTDGPLSPYRKIGLSILFQLSEAKGLRNMLAHGRVKMIGPEMIEIDHFITDDSGQHKRDWRRFTLAELEHLASSATRLSRRASKGLRIIDQKKLLPPLV